MRYSPVGRTLELAMCLGVTLSLAAAVVVLNVIESTSVRLIVGLYVGVGALLLLKRPVAALWRGRNLRSDDLRSQMSAAASLVRIDQSISDVNQIELVSVEQSRTVFRVYVEKHDVITRPAMYIIVAIDHPTLSASLIAHDDARPYRRWNYK